MIRKRLIVLGLGCMLLPLPFQLAAQQDQESVAEAARKAQAAKKKSTLKAKMVIDDDNVGSITGTINVVGQEPASPEDQTKGAAADKTKAATEQKPAVKDEAYWRLKFADANRKLADDQHELDILQREYNLKQEQYYADPMAGLKQEYTRQDLKDTKVKISDKAAAIEQDKQDISSLEDQLRQSGGDPGWSRR